ncbi:protein TIFY 4B-like isoform X2 [Tasmannia lanceolata]|uniref:protein TIFY 4B-like isoform X2 n=1 Tax=Tasmannia lanceolata TaxID=3420 RepID=UPI0040628BCE
MSRYFSQKLSHKEIAGVRPESDVMTTAGTNFRSALDKPVGELTEEDILQLTREDCRRYLKEKGMRRPSWNKSQAIQQVISLKTLLERQPVSGDSGAGIRQRVSIPVPENPPHIAFSSPHLQVSTSENGSDRGRDSVLLSFSGDATCRIPATGGENICTISPSQRDKAGTNGPVGQMTIFYCGNVNVYEGVSADKARAIMQLAGNPNSLPNDPPCIDSLVIPPFLACSPIDCVRPNPASPPLTAVISATAQTGKMPQYSRENSEDWKISREIESEGPTSRKASLQRYLEKRKDRCSRSLILGQL